MGALHIFARMVLAETESDRKVIALLFCKLKRGHYHMPDLSMWLSNMAWNNEQPGVDDDYEKSLE